MIANSNANKPKIMWWRKVLLHKQIGCAIVLFGFIIEMFNILKQIATEMPKQV